MTPVDVMNTVEFERHLRAAATRYLESLGGDVRVFAGADNLVRPDENSPPLFRIEVEGVPNLLHELTHVLLIGRLEKDHGTDPAGIPFDMTGAPGRRLLLEELVCCALSCAWFPGDAAAMRAWFEEQVGIQGLFFGCRERDFVARAGAVLEAHAEEACEIEQRGLRALTTALATAGAPPEVARPRHAVHLSDLWHGLVGGPRWGRCPEP